MDKNAHLPEEKTKKKSEGVKKYCVLFCGQLSQNQKQGMGNCYQTF